MIVGTPSDEFGGQELATASEIQAFLDAFGPPAVTFTVLEKGQVNGDGATDYYKFMREATGSGKIKWNFATQYLVEPNGKVTRFDGKSPKDLVPDIEAALDAATGDPKM